MRAIANISAIKPVNTLGAIPAKIGGGGMWDITTAVYDSKYFDVSPQDSTAYDIAFNANGTRMYCVGFSTHIVYQYRLSTAWDISTAAYDSKSFDLGSASQYTGGITFDSTGTKIYYIGFSSKSIYQYSLSTAWDISTASYDSKSFSVALQDGSLIDIAFDIIGTRMFLTGRSTKSVYQYSLSTAWDISTAAYDSKSFSVASQDSYPYGAVFNLGGTRMFMPGRNSGSVYQYSLSTAWDISTAAYDSKSFDVSSQDSPNRLAISPDGAHMFILGRGEKNIFQYSLGA